MNIMHSIPPCTARNKTKLPSNAINWALRTFSEKTINDTLTNNIVIGYLLARHTAATHNKASIRHFARMIGASWPHLDRYVDSYVDRWALQAEEDWSWIYTHNPAQNIERRALSLDAVTDLRAGMPVIVTIGKIEKYKSVIEEFDRDKVSLISRRSKRLTWVPAINVHPATPWIVF